jgi:hypothetical protein
MSTARRSISPKTWLSLVMYLIVPLCSLLLILQLYPELPKERFYMRIYWVIPSATVIVLLSYVGSFYQKGETKRYILNICFTLATMIWMFGLLGGGLVMTSLWNEYEFSLHMERYVFLIGCVAGLNILYYTLEWRVYQNENVVVAAERKKATFIPVK